MALPKLNLVPDQANYAVNPAKDIITVELDSGYARRRKDIANASRIVNVQWIMTPDEYQYYNAFYNTTLRKGLDFFLIDLLLDQPYVEEYEARIVAESSQLSATEGLTYYVDAQLEIIPIDSSDIDEIVVALFGEPDFFDYLEQFANYDIKIDT